MIRTFALAPARVVWAVATALALFLGSAGDAHAQGGPRPKARDLMKAGIDSNKRGEYEAAAQFFEQAEMGKATLTPSEQNDLTRLAQQNSSALEGRMQGASQIEMSLFYLEQGNAAEAGKLLRAAAANAYLSPAQKQAVRDLNDRLKTASAGAAATAKMMSEPVNNDMKSLLSAARAALARGELEMAEAFCQAADKVGYTIPAFLHPWSDTPTKVRRDISTARAKLAAPPKTDIAVEKKDSSPFGFMKGMFGGSNPPKKDGRVEPKDAPIAKGIDKPGPKDMLPVTHSTAYPKDPRHVDGPDLKPPTGAPSRDRDRAIQLVKDGDAAMRRGDLATAQKLALEAKALKVELNGSDPNPDRLLSDIEKRASATPSKNLPKAVKGTPAEAKALVKESRKLLEANNIDDAERVMLEAAGIAGVRWGLFEDNPEKIRGDIQRLRTKRDHEDAAKLLAEARALYAAGNYHESRLKALQSHKLYGKLSIWHLGDRPERLINDLNRAEMKNKKDLVLPDPIKEPGSYARPGPLDPKNVAKGPKIEGKKEVPPVGLPASVASAERQKAGKLLAEARELQKKGQVIQARDKALEARKLGVMFSPEEDSPDAALWSLAAQCDNYVQGYMKRAAELAGNASDPERFKKAKIDLEAARALALAFRHDMKEIDQKFLWLQQTAMAAGAEPVTKVAHEVVAEGPAASGRKLLDSARLELRAGNTTGSRRIAEEAYHPKYGVQEEAASVLRSIDAEEANQIRMGAERNARAAIDAFLRKDYKVAHSIIAAVDWKHLPPELHARIREISAAPQMALADEHVQTVAAKDGVPPKGGIAGPSDIDEGFGDKYRSMEKIQFQQLRERTLVTLSNAHDLISRGRHDDAIELLNEQLGQLTKSSLEPELMSPLKRQVDFRLQQYRTLKAQASLEASSTKFIGPKHDESARTRAIAKQQQDCAEKCKLAAQFMKEGKITEAHEQYKLALALDADNLAAQSGYQITELRKRLAEWENNKKRNEVWNYDELSNDYGELANTKNPYRFSTDPKHIARVKNRGLSEGIGTTRRNAFQKAVDEKLNKQVSVKFVNTKLADVLETLRLDAGGVNIIPDNRALLEESISLDQPISYTFENLPLRSALNIVLRDANLTFMVKEDHILITTKTEAKGKIEQKVHSVADLVIPVENHTTHTVNNMQDALMRHIQSQTGGVVSTPPSPYVPNHGMAAGTPVSSSQSGLGSMFAANSPGAVSGPGGVSISKTNSNTIEDMLIDLIQKSVASHSWKEMGGQGTIQYYPLGMALVINQSAEVQEQVLDLLTALRRLQDLEVAIEMKLVNVSEAFFERLGMDFDVNIRTGTSRREPDLVNGQFVPFGFVNRNLDRLGIVSGLTPAGTLTPDLNIPLRSSSFDFSVPPFGGFPGTLGADGGLSLGLAFLSDIQVFMFMEAAQGDRRTQVMQAPKITVFNGQTANIAVGDQQFFLTGVSLGFVGATPFFTPQNQPFPLQVQLQVTPVISADRRFVRLNLTPQMTNLASATVPLIPIQFPVPQLLEGPGTGQTAAGQQILFQMFFQQPTFSTISVNTTVNVPDGGTVLLGGLKTMSEARNEFGPPILSKIPYINRLFKNVGYGREVSSLMIMVTPRIIINEEEEAIFLGQLEPIPRE